MGGFDALFLWWLITYVPHIFSISFVPFDSTCSCKRLLKNYIIDTDQASGIRRIANHPSFICKSMILLSSQASDTCVLLLVSFQLLFSYPPSASTGCKPSLKILQWIAMLVSWFLLWSSFLNCNSSHVRGKCFKQAIAVSTIYFCVLYFHIFIFYFRGYYFGVVDAYLELNSYKFRWRKSPERNSTSWPEAHLQMFNLCVVAASVHWNSLPIYTLGAAS